MIVGLPRWNNPDTYYSQENNAVEQILRKVGADHVLESCGPTAACSVLDALGIDLTAEMPDGVQPEDALALWMNSPANYPEMMVIRDIDPDQYMGNRVPQWYQASIPSVFHVPTEFKWGVAREALIAGLSLPKPHGFMVQLTKPGHYVSVVAYDKKEDAVIYNDGWKGNSWPERLKGTSGFNRKSTWEEFGSNLESFRIEIG